MRNLFTEEQVNLADAIAADDYHLTSHVAHELVDIVAEAVADEFMTASEAIGYVQEAACGFGYDNLDSVSFVEDIAEVLGYTFHLG